VDNHSIVTVWDNRSMIDAQLMTLALAVIIPLSLLIYSNSRITDAKETLRADIRTLSAELKGELFAETAKLRGEMAGLRGEMTGLKAEIMGGFDKLEAKLAIHELEHHRS
jgi:hypothetical protein